MNSAKRFLMIAGAFILATLTFTIANPKAVHAFAATLVQVVNTSANPIPTSEAATRFQAALCQVSGPISSAYNAQGQGPCPTPTNVDHFTVPTITSTGAAVKRVQVDNVSGFCSSFNSSNVFVKAVRLRSHQFVPDSIPNGNATFTHYVPIVGAGTNYINDPSFGPPIGGVQESDYTYGQTTQFTLSPGDTVNLESLIFITNPSDPQDYFCVSRIEGYFVTQ